MSQIDKEGGTHRTERLTNIDMAGGGGGWMVLSGNNTTSWLHLASWNLPDSQLSSESKMEPSVATSFIILFQIYIIKNSININSININLSSIFIHVVLIIRRSLILRVDATKILNSFHFFKSFPTLQISIRKCIHPSIF